MTWKTVMIAAQCSIYVSRTALMNRVKDLPNFQDCLINAVYEANDRALNENVMSFEFYVYLYF